MFLIASWCRGFNRKRLAEARDRFLMAALVFQQRADPDKQSGVFRFPLNGGLEGGNRFQGAPLGRQVNSKIAVGVACLRVVSDDVGEEGAGIAVDAGMVPGEEACHRQDGRPGRADDHPRRPRAAFRQGAETQLTGTARGAGHDGDQADAGEVLKTVGNKRELHITEVHEAQHRRQRHRKEQHADQRPATQRPAPAP